MPIRRKHKRNQLDRVDAESIKEMTQTRGWKLFEQRAALLRAATCRDVLQQQAEIETAYKRGLVSGIDAVLSIPVILYREGSRHVSTENDEG